MATPSSPALISDPRRLGHVPRQYHRTIRLCHLGVTALLAFLLAGCVRFGVVGLRGQYLTGPGYGYDFVDEQTVYGLAGETIGKGTFTVEGSTVRMCFGVLCNDLTLDGDCLVDDDHSQGRYCKEP